MWILIEILSRDHVKGKKYLNNLKFGTFIGGFWSDSAASMAVKALKANSQADSQPTYTPNQASEQIKPQMTA